jgi:hypothetical protein
MEPRCRRQRLLIQIIILNQVRHIGLRNFGLVRKLVINRVREQVSKAKQLFKLPIFLAHSFDVTVIHLCPSSLDIWREKTPDVEPANGLVLSLRISLPRTLSRRFRTSTIQAPPYLIQESLVEKLPNARVPDTELRDTAIPGCESYA